MSEQETVKGKIRLVEADDIEEFAKNKINGELLEYYDSYTEQLLSNYNYCDKYIKFNGRLYEVIESINYGGEDIFEASKNEDETISFLVSYYDGALCFSEAIEIALKRIKNE